MSLSIDLSQYVPVRDRVRAFYDRFPAGSLQTELFRLGDGLVIVKALVFRDPQDPRPTTGWAYERIATNAGDPLRAVEHCETAAIGRALANRNLAGRRRPSREEMEKVRRMSQAESTRSELRAQSGQRRPNGLPSAP